MNVIPSGARSVGDVDEDGEARTVTLVLRLRLGSESAPSGSIRRTGCSDPIRFNGWMDLMGAVNQLRDEAEAT